MKRAIENLSLKKKIIFYIYIVITPILILISGILMWQKVGQTKSKVNAMQMASLHSLSDSFYIAEQDVINMSTYIAINQRVNYIITSDKPELFNENSRFWSHEEPMQMVTDMLALKGYIKTVALYPENGVNPYLKCIDASSYVQTIDEIKNTDTYNKALELKGKMFWVKVDKGESDLYLGNRNGKLLLCREIYDLSQKKPLAFLTLGIAEEKIENLCLNAMQEDGESIAILSNSVEIITSYGEMPSQEMRNLYQQKNIKSGEHVYENGKYILYSYQADYKSSVVCKVVPKSHLWENISQVIYMPLALLFGVLLGLYPVLIIVSNIVIKPLALVCEAMGKFRRGDFTQQVKVDTNDEIGEVATCFNKMVVDMRQLINTNYVMALREKESELATLQAQINPHFLYNTLDSIYWQANNEGNEEIAERIYSLSQLFRLVLGQGNAMVHVEQECELLYRYLEIQKMRFTKQLNYSIEIDPEISQAFIPKLILQPFVENAVIHGIENALGPCDLVITGRRRNENIEFVISDTGVGMTSAEIDSIWEATQDRAYKSHRMGGYAIKNVKERLELKYQDNFTLHIESQKGKGTKITFILPLEFEREE